MPVTTGNKHIDREMEQAARDLQARKAKFIQDMVKRASPVAPADIPQITDDPTSPLYRFNESMGATNVGEQVPQGNMEDFRRRTSAMIQQHRDDQVPQIVAVPVKGRLSILSPAGFHTITD